MASNDFENGVWRTIGGRRVFIREGQSLSDAMKASGKFKSVKKKNEVKDESKSFTREELKEKYGTDNTDIINAGKAKEDRVTLKEGTPLQKMANDRIKEKENTLANDKAMLEGMKRQGIDEIQGWKKEDFENRIKKNEEYLKIAKEQPEGAKFSKMLEESNVKTFADEIKEQNKIETISKAEYDKMPNDYKGTLKELVETAEFRGENKQDLIKQYEKMGYDVNKDKTILVNEKGGTVLKPVKISDESGKDNNWKQEEGGVTTRKTNEGTNYIQGVKKADGSKEYTRTDYDKNGNELSSKTYKSLDEAKNANQNNNWQEQIKANNAKMEKDVTNLQNKINEYRTRSAQSSDALERYQLLKEADKLQNQYYERFRENERANAKIKVETPNEKYMNVEAYAGYKDKFNDTWGKDGSSDKVVSAKMYTNDEFMEHLEDANWHSERKQLLEANLTNQELAYIKDKTKVSAWGVENLTGKEQVDRLIKEAKSQNNSINNSLRRKAYQKYLKEHPASEISFEDFKDMRK